MTFGSLFSGIGGFDLGLERAGLGCRWQVEIDPKCGQLLSSKWPTVERHQDVRAVGADLARVDLICGGFPCQDLSVAGRRAGLDGERSGLWFEFHRILEIARPRWCLIENVPGLLSGCGCLECRALARVLRIHARIRERTGAKACALCLAARDFHAAHSGRNFQIILAGLVALGYGVTWRVLDAQYAGLAQRRERIFIVGSLGNGGSVPVLLEPESVRWNPAPRRSPRERPAFTLGASVRGSGGNAGNAWNTDFVAPALRASGAGSARAGDSRGQDAVIAAPISSGGGKGVRGGRGDGADMITPALRVGGREQGAGSSSDTPLVAGTIRSNMRNNSDPVTEAGGLISDTVTSKWAGGPAGHETQNLIADPISASEGKTYTHEGEGNFRLHNVVSGVRRLTPRECERLQGFPDDWTAAFDDSTRYKMLGNAVPPPEAEWIGKRMMAT